MSPSLPITSAGYSEVGPGALGCKIDGEAGIVGYVSLQRDRAKEAGWERDRYLQEL